MALEQNQNNFKKISLGQTIIKYQVPRDIFITINRIYEKKYKNLVSANSKLAGKIEKEHSLFTRGKSKDSNFNVLSLDVLNWFEKMFTHYLKDYNKIKGYKKFINSIWVNQMFEHEYNPVHVHQGSLYTGLSSVMILKLPQSFGVEYSSEHNPMNGRLQMMGSVSGQFATCDYSPDIKERDFYIFPYDVRHCVYPFNGPGYRRTLSANCDVEYNPIMNRGRN